MQATKEQIIKLGRLKRRSDFLRVQGTGRKWISKSLILQIAPIPAENDEISNILCRVGFTVSKRVSKSAVRRNRAKRRLRAAAADILPDYAAPGYDFVLVGRAGTLDRSYDELKNDLKWCLKRMDVRRDMAATSL